MPLLDPDVRLVGVPPDSLGRPGFGVQRPGRPEATLYFGADGRLVRLDTMLAGPAGAPGVREDIALDGISEAAGDAGSGA